MSSSSSPPKGPTGGSGGSSNNPGGGGNKLRLNLSRSSSPLVSSTTTTAAATTTTTPQQSPHKKARKTFYTPAPISPHVAQADRVHILHQVTHLSWILNDRGAWHGQGHTTLYVIHKRSSSSAADAAKSVGTIEPLALHLRGCVDLKQVQIEALPKKWTTMDNKTKQHPLQPRNTSFIHADPLEHVLIKPATTYYTMQVDDNDNDKQKQPSMSFDADAQCSRGAAGMTHGLRAASIASVQGEVRISYERPEPLFPKTESTTTTTKTNTNNNNNDIPTTKAAQQTLQMATEAWKTALQSSYIQQEQQQQQGSAKSTLQQRLQQERQPAQYQARLERCSELLARASCQPGDNAALKITCHFDLPSGAAEQHYGGLHVLHSSGSCCLPPHIYTTSGLHGDHEGPRCWLPCLDSAAVHHRASHEMTVTVTAGLKQGISVLGLGQDFGLSQAYYWHKQASNTIGSEPARALFGEAHLSHWQRVQQQQQQQQQQKSAASTLGHLNASRSSSTAHVIPPDTGTEEAPALSINDINVTQVWCTASWSPIPIRSLGFAIGPFRVLEDAEYFGKAAIRTMETAGNHDGNDSSSSSSDSEDDESVLADRHAEFVKGIRDRGEGIRQAYLAPKFWRKHVHAKANRDLLPDARLLLRPMTLEQRELMYHMDQAVQCATVGVPHRALSLMRDVLALPTYRTAAYTQIWIPHALHGGATSGALHQCPEVLVNPFLGGAIMDATLLPPTQMRLPYYHGGRVLQCLQARNCVRGWITASLPLGGNDHVGHGYIPRLIEALLMSIYERGHGAFGEGGARGGIFHARRYALNSGLNSSNLDFLPVKNMEDIDGVVAAVPLDETQNDYLWRSATNGTESHTSAIDEFNVRQLLCKDVVEVVERGTDKDKQVPSPSMGWAGVFGSYLSTTFLSSNSSSSSNLGCGAVEMMHPLGGATYRSMKMDSFRSVVESRAGIANFIRLARASFVAAHLADIGQKKLVLPKRPEKKGNVAKDVQRGEFRDKQQSAQEEELSPFVVCVNEILSKGGMTHTLFTRALQNMCGRHRESLLAGTLVDVEPGAVDPRTRKVYVDPEGFPNSYIRAASMMYCRVGVQVEQQSRDTGGGTAVAKSTQCQIFAEPVIPEGGVAFGGQITVRVIENEGQFREYEKDLTVDGSRRDWGSMTLYAKPVSTPQAQAAASGSLESKGSKGGGDSKLEATTGDVFTDSNFHGGGFQAIELIRLTNLTPLLWVRIDPQNMYGGRISVFQPDACLAEMLFHDGDAGAQLDAIRSLSERPLRIQGSLKVSVIHGVNVSELPVRLLGDCLRGSSALHSSLPHTPGVRRHAALAIGQWQNNKGPTSKNAVGTDSWIGLNLLIQYFQERFYSNSVVMPVKYSRVAVKSSEAETRQNASEVGGSNPKPTHDETYEYLDTLDEGEERTTAMERAEDVEAEEDEEYRVRSACVTAIASIRAQDGQTPAAVTSFLEAVLESEDASMTANLVCPDDELMAERLFKKIKERKTRIRGSVDDSPLPSLSYNSGMLVADTLLALCHVNVWPEVYTDPTTGRKIQASGKHPVAKLMELAQNWLEWELYRERIRAEVDKEAMTAIGGTCHNVVASSAIVSLATLAILKQCTMSKSAEDGGENVDAVAKASYYTSIFDFKPSRNDLTRAAAAQAMTCICCAADRFEVEGVPALGLLSALEFLLDRIALKDTSPSLRQTLALIMMDACTGKVCSMQRVGTIAGRNDLYSSASRFFCGPLGASHGGDNGSAMLTTVSVAYSPAASAVNDGARRGLKLLNRAGHPRDTSIRRDVVVRVARFATRLWRIINGELPEPPSVPTKAPLNGVCAYDGALRCCLLGLWNWLYPKGCLAVLQVQSWPENTADYKTMGANLVMKISEEEKSAAKAEEDSLSDISRLVEMEIERQAFRGEMAQKAYTIFKASDSKSSMQDGAAAEQGIDQPLPPIQRDNAFKQGGWVASAAQQRRSLALDGGTAVTKLRLKVGGAK